MITMNTSRLVIVSCLALAVACVDNLQTPETNVTPVAAARVLDDERVMPSFSFTAPALELTLDASKSRDLDGSIAGYRWLSATQLQDADAGPVDARRWVPDGEPADWPEDVQQPSVRLPGPGSYSFMLWVTDDGGRISDPSTLTIEVTGS
jgi:hypothetical protein